MSQWEISISCWTNRFELNARITAIPIEPVVLYPNYVNVPARCKFFLSVLFFFTFNWRQFMGNNFMACSKASNFDAIIIVPIHCSFFTLCFVFIIKKHFIPFYQLISHYYLHLSLFLSLSRAFLSLWVHNFSLGFWLFGGATLNIIEQWLSLLALVVTIFSVMVIFITGFYVVKLPPVLYICIWMLFWMPIFDVACLWYHSFLPFLVSQCVPTVKCVCYLCSITRNTWGS